MRLRAAAVLVLAGTALAVPAAPARAAACASSSGVTVVVDFASLGGGTHRECAAGDPASGLAALRAAGFTPTRAAQEPGYFLCRINGKPTNDPCQRTSPANAYWSYWHAKPGGRWTHSDLGPADYDPAPGTVEGWAFGAGKPPSSPPRMASPSAAPATPSAVGSHPTPTTAVARSRPPSPASAATAAAPAKSPTSGPAPTSPASVLVTPAPSPLTSTAPRTDPAPSRGTSTGPLAAAVLLALLITGAAVVGVRRRREDGS
jgi:hypothetical protein